MRIRTYGVVRGVMLKHPPTRFIVKDGRAVPVVVKSGKSHPRHSALRKVLSGGGSGIREAYVLWNGNVRADGRITYLPAYMAMFIRNE